MRLLILACTFSHYHGSEPSVDWGFVSILPKYQDLCVMIDAEKFGGTDEP
jgi:hypothetical protein